MSQATRISVSQQMFARFERRKHWRRFVAVSFLLLYLAYLVWRCTILNKGSLTLSLLYLFAEILGFVLSCGTILKSWSYRHRMPQPLVNGLKVDVFIPSYEEPTHIIRQTLMAAKAIEYPHQTWVLDDGRRNEIRDLAAELSINYLSRPNNIHAKAGNLNYGLKHSTADFIMVFDADHIALPHALNITLGFFADEKIAMVQTPQDYYNATAFQYMNCKKTGALWHDQSFFYNTSEPCHDAINSSSCLGTGVVYRRKVLDEIGGIPTVALTEDTHTSLKINKLGYHTVYLNEVIAYGIAASDLSEYYTTRRRWGHGNIQVVQEEAILSHKGFTWHQRLTHLVASANFLEGWQQLLLLFIPICTLVFGLAPFEISIFNVLVTFFFPFVSYAMLQEIGCGFSRLWTNEIFSMIRWPLYLQVTKALFGRELKWSSSLKNIKGKVSWNLMAPQLVVLFASIAALMVAFFTLQKNHFETGPLFAFLQANFLAIFGSVDANYIAPNINTVMVSGYTVDLVLISGIWVAYNIFRVVFFVKKVLYDTKNSHEFFRFTTPFPVTINVEKKLYGRILEISEEWISFVDHSPEPLMHKVGGEIEILLHLPARSLKLRILIEKVQQKNIGGKIIWDSVKSRDLLTQAIYSIDWHREFLNRNAYFLTPSDFLLKILTLKSPIEQKYESWNSLLYQGKMAVIGDFKKEKNLASLIVFEELKIGAAFSGVRITKTGSEIVILKILQEEPLSSLVEKGLDGASVRRYSVTGSRVKFFQNDIS